MTTTLAFPDDDPTRRYQAEGLAAMAAALECNGPIAPVPYHPAPLPKRRRRTRVPRAERDVILSEPYRLYVLGYGPRPTFAAERLAA